MRDKVPLQPLGLLRKLRRRSPGNWKGEGIERLVADQENCPDRIEESKMGRSGREMGIADAVHW